MANLIVITTVNHHHHGRCVVSRCHLTTPPFRRRRHNYQHRSCCGHCNIILVVTTAVVIAIVMIIAMAIVAVIVNANINNTGACWLLLHVKLYATLKINVNINITAMAGYSAPHGHTCTSNNLPQTAPKTSCSLRSFSSSRAKQTIVQNNTPFYGGPKTAIPEPRGPPSKISLVGNRGQHATKRGRNTANCCKPHPPTSPQILAARLLRGTTQPKTLSTCGALRNFRCTARIFVFLDARFGAARGTKTIKKL